MWDNDTSVSFKVMAFLRKSGSLVAVWIKSFATAARCSFWSSNRSCGTNFATTNFMPRSCVKISDTVVLGIPRSTSSSHCQLLTFVDCSLYRVNILRCCACCRPSRTWITFQRFCTIFEAFVPHFYFHCTHCIIPGSLLNHLNSFCRRMYKLNAEFLADLLLYLLILNAMPTQYTSSLNEFYCPHWPGEWSRHCSGMCTLVHPLWLPGYINVVQTVLFILTMSGLFLDRLICT